ncbi:potassium-transporting ATPase subunit KdpC [Salinicola sp. CPA57]|uniref:potassium-transporting ATPase subunit KdpC n=1 Tax=Salinicola sp. CPA57 TaxID=1949080 RepID=UPI000DA1CE08|nr:potassium-transporting ATPase subunit KdpC [Salinicola sp. CPA57]
MSVTDSRHDISAHGAQGDPHEASHATQRSAGNGSWLTAVRFSLLMAVVLGLLYPLVVVGLGQLGFSHQANGSLLADAEGRVIGSSLVGQRFTSERYFQGRPSAVDYAAGAVGGSNLAPSNPALRERAEADAGQITARDGVEPGRIPVDLLTASGSGIDPAISPEAAAIQVDRVARARGLSPSAVTALVERYSDSGGWLGQPTVNVLALNLALDAIE